MSNSFGVDKDILRGNATAARDHAHKLREWIDQYDNPDYYQALSRSVGLINSPNVEALREHGRKLRQDVELVASRYDAIADGSLGAVEDVTSGDEASAINITKSTREL